MGKKWVCWCKKGICPLAITPSIIHQISRNEYHLKVERNISKKIISKIGYYSNLRVVGLDSNPGYQLDIQLNWLDGVLEDACYRTNIDFVFAQLHHPYKSELWLAGETDFTGEVISRIISKPPMFFISRGAGFWKLKIIEIVICIRLMIP